MKIIFLILSIVIFIATLTYLFIVHEIVEEHFNSKKPKN